MPRLVLVKSSRAWIVYSVIRLGTFAVALAILLLMNVMWPWVAALVAAVISLCVSYIFLRGPRNRVAGDIHARRFGEQHDVDNEIENAALDRIEAEKAERAE
jgi:L-lactate permease